MRISTIRWGIWFVVCGGLVHAAMADDGYIKSDGHQWTLGTAAVERVVAFEDGKLLLKSFKDKAAGRELIVDGAPSDEFFVSVDDAKHQLTGSTGPWKFVGEKQTKLKQGELQLELTLERDALRVTKTYVVYPGSSIIRQWVTFANAGNSALKIIEPGFLNETIRPGDAEAIDFHWMTGGENSPGSWLLKTEKLSASKRRTFDSYEPFTAAPTFPGDGVKARILLNGRQVWPASGWLSSANATVSAPVDFSVNVAAGDKLAFLVNMNGNIGFDTTAIDPTIRYDGGETHLASKEFSDKQGTNDWRYQYVEGGKYVDLVYYPAPKQWRKEKDNATGTPFVGAGNQHPDVNQDAVRVWTAPKTGRVRVTATVCNSGNQPVNTSIGGTNYGERMGSTSYAPWYALLAKDTREGVVVGWDYFGHWASSFERQPSGTVTIRLKVAGHKQTLAPGESVTTPKAFVGLFRDDLDEAGNEVLDWQYRYLWDYTRRPWFPAIRVLGYWMKGTGGGQPGVGWTGGKPDWASTFRKVFRVADLMRYIGGDVYHRDWGWWDRAGDWNGPDFRATGKYLKKSGIGQLIYAFLYTVDPESKVAKEHPGWICHSPQLGVHTLDMSMPEVVNFIEGQLDDFHGRWGDFEWRNDSYPTTRRDGDDTCLLGQDAGLRKIIVDFLDKYPASAFQGVNGGGNDVGYDYARYASTISFSDGAVGILRNYYESFLLPPDKSSDIPDVWNPNDYNKATWRGLLCINFDMTGDTWDRGKLEGIRELIDIYHYLHREGVVGRWVRVYRPIISGDDPTMYFQRLSGDRRRGVIIVKRPPTGAVTVRPKGLLPGEKYVVSFHESNAAQQRSGADLMERGIPFNQMNPGELIYLNLPFHPGSKLDKDPPTAPRGARKQTAKNMGYPGVELTWKPASDDNWLSYYEVFRDGTAIDRVAKGCYYFDHSAGADLAAKYELRAVDGAGNVSRMALADGKATRRSRVVDDVAGGAVAHSGTWQSRSGFLPAFLGTLTSSNQKGATASLAFKGKRVLWFCKLGADAGKAAVSVDGGPAEIVDTYSADDIWGVCVFCKEFAEPGEHTLRITVLGEHGPRAADSTVAIDGFRVEP
jgi:hypothetical protein